MFSVFFLLTLSRAALGLTSSKLKKKLRAKDLVDAELQASLDAAQQETVLARTWAFRAEALSRKLAAIRERVEGCGGSEEEDGKEGGEEEGSGSGGSG